MARISKDPVIRQAELMDAAEELFLSVGYQKTAIQDIVRKVGVAQGTFYYHYPSKEVVLEAIVTRHVERLTAALQTPEFAAQSGLRQLEQLISRFYALCYSGKPGQLCDVLYEEGQRQLVSRAWTSMLKLLPPLLLPILERCNREQSACVEHSEETFWYFAGILGSLLESRRPLEYGKQLDAATRQIHVTLAERLLEALFAMKKNSLHITL